MRILVATILAVLSSVPPAAAEDGDRIWSALVLATSPEKPEPAPKALRPYEPMLARIFGYTQFQIVGQHSQKVESDQEKWLLPSRHFFLRVDSRRNESGEFELKLMLYQDDRLLVETKARLGEGSPLLIRGPLYGQGQLIILLVVR